MEYKLVKLTQLSGDEASVYSLYVEDEQQTLYERFISENVNSFKSEIIDINERLKIIGNDNGARESYFKIHEGVPGDGVCALYDSPNKKLRLYCIRYGTLLVIIGGGGEKPKNIKALQEDPKLTEENDLMKRISQDITQRLKDRDIKIINDGLDLEGDLIFNLEEDE